MSALPLNLNLHFKQGEALQSRATEILYGGAAGGGKSHLMRVAAILWCCAIPGLQCYFFRRIRDDLVKNHMEGPKGFRSLLADWADAGLINIVEDEIRFWNGSKIYLCHCKDEKDVYKYQGAEIHVLCIDEATHFTESMYRFLRSRVRMVGLTLPPEYQGRFPKILASANPGNIGHLWVKATFVDFAAPMTVTQTEPKDGGMLRQFIPARLEDNPSMETDDPGYEMKLQGMGSATLVLAMRYGDWDVIEGAFFDIWDRQRHVIRPFEIPKTWTRFRALDWGYAKPFSVGWYAISDGELARFPKGALIKYREWYGRNEPNVGIRLDAEDLGRGVLEREKDDPPAHNGGRRLGVADPSIFAEDGGPSIAERMSNVGCAWYPADNKRIPGWDQVRSRLQGEDDIGTGIRPMLYFFETCTDSIRTIPALQHDETKAEDLDTDGEDHAADETRYACMSRPYVRANQPAPEPKYIVVGGKTTVTMNDAWKERDRQRSLGEGRI
jgi:hypothetical protein